MPASAYLIACHENLPARLAQKLGSLDTRDLSRVAVVLPTRRLQNYLRLELARHLTACIPPVILTLADLVRRLPARHDRRMISEEEKRLILNNLILNGGYRHLRPGMETDIGAFFNEIVNENLQAKAFERLRELLQQDPYRSEAHLQRLLEQTAEWEKLFREFKDFLARNRLTDQALDFAGRVRHAPDSPPLTERWQVQQFIVAGFADATQIQLLLLQRLQQTGAGAFWFQGDPALLAPEKDDAGAPVQPFARLQRLMENLHLHEAEFLESPAPEPPGAAIVRAAFGREWPEPPAAADAVSLHIHAATTRLDEVKAAAAWVRQLIQQEGMAPEEIVVAVPDEGAYGRLIWSVFEQAGVPLNFALGMPFYQTGIGHWLRLFFEIARNDWRLTDILSVFNHPSAGAWLQFHGIETPPRELQSELKRLAQKNDVPQGRADFLESSFLFPKSAAGQFLALLDRILVDWQPGAKKSVPHWADALWQLSEDLGLSTLFATLQHNPFNIEARARSAWFEHMHNLTRSASYLDAKISLGELFSLLMQNIFSSLVYPAGEPFIGVQVLGLRETVGLPARALLILGCVEGGFPKIDAKEIFISDPLRARIGLATRSKLERLQDQHFARLAAGIPQVHLFYHENAAETRTVKSRYIQRLELLQARGLPAFVAHRDPGRVLKGDFLADAELARALPILAPELAALQARAAARCDARGHFPGDLLALLSSISATSLDSLLWCPYRFLLHRLRIGEEELPEEESNPRQVGGWAHNICHRFFTGLNPEKEETADFELYDPWTTPITEANGAAALARLAGLSRFYQKRLRRRLDALYHMLYRGWPKFVEREIARPVWQFGSRFFEIKLTESPAEVEDSLGFPVTVKGRLDRIIVSGDSVRILDYKLRSKGATKTEIREGKAAQLPLYFALLKEQDEFANNAQWAGEYYSLWNGDGNELADEPGQPELAEAWMRLLERWQDVVRHVLEQHVLEPLQDEKACRLCSFANICRLNEPHYAPRLAEAFWRDA